MNNKLFNELLPYLVALVGLITFVIILNALGKIL